MSPIKYSATDCHEQEVQPEFVDKTVIASCCLHNMLCADNAFESDNKSLLLREAALLNLDPPKRNSTRGAFQVREKWHSIFYPI